MGVSLSFRTTKLEVLHWLHELAGYLGLGSLAMYGAPWTLEVPMMVDAFWMRQVIEGVSFKGFALCLVTTKRLMAKRLGRGPKG